MRTTSEIVAHARATSEKNAAAMRDRLAPKKHRWERQNPLSKPDLAEYNCLECTATHNGAEAPPDGPCEAANAVKPYTPTAEEELIAEKHPDGQQVIVDGAVVEPPPPTSGAIITAPIERVVEGRNVRKLLGDLTELVQSIQQQGILQRPLVRPLPDDTFEIVIGHRRVAAARQAGLKEIELDVRHLTDVQVVEAQLVENLQRRDLDPIDEGEGFKRLQDEFKRSTAEIATRVARSPRWVQTRIQLTKLCPEAKKALSAGKLPVDTALRIAAIPSHKLQADATAKVTTPAGLNGEVMSVRAAREWIAEEYTTELANAPFNTKDPFLVPEAGACGPCPKRTGANPDLFGDMYSKANVCTDVPCFKAKKQAAWEAQQEKAKAAGKKVLPLAEGARLFKNGAPSFDSDYVDLDAPCPEDSRKRTWREVLGDEALEAKDGKSPVVVAPDLQAKPHELLPKDDAIALAKAKGAKWAQRAAELEAERKPSSKEDAAAKERAAQVLALAEAAAMGKLVEVAEQGVNTPLLRMMCFGLAQEHHPEVLARRGLETDRDLHALIEKTTSMGKLLGILFELCVTGWVKGFGEFSQEMRTVAQAMKVDLNKILKAQEQAFEAESLFDKKEPAKKGGKK